ncbi:hypothetical protein E2P81_ATG02454 [Venturia nashicola]|uniref:Uncharacterized protein n=1 Tax=Venturia nashicola TaxID=86259 RepID=A0A4Z1P5C4_9PEZI|nr:hypothetical protein E6O75_ATG02512 [Venturia nashicola]TLD36672.1 hypothetical protein E2P81_ATG02454 [Venturia nashicola]
MDPIAAFGLVASVLQVAATGVAVVHTLDSFRRSYSAAPDTVNALSTEVACISISISQIKELFEERNQELAEKLRAKPELSKALAVCLAGCQHILSSLDGDVKKVQQTERRGEGKFGLKRRASFMWKKDSFRTYLDQIHGHQSALNLLLQALQLHSLSEIEALLRKEKTRSILQEMDKATLRGSPSIPYLESCNNDAELDTMKVFHLEPSWGAISPNTIDKPHLFTVQILEEEQEELLIDLNDPQTPQTPQSPTTEPLSPALEQMRMLDLKDYTMEKEVAVFEKAKYGSVRSVRSTDRRRDLWHAKVFASSRLPLKSVSSEPMCIIDSGPRCLSPVSPISLPPMSIFRLDRSASVASSYADSSRTLVALESEYPEAVIMDSRVDAFPFITEPTPLLPLHWREEEALLDSERARVLRSKNSEEHLNFAEAALHFCTIAKHHNIRKSRLETVPEEETHVQRILQADAKQFVLRYAESGHAKALFLQSMYFDLDHCKTFELQKAALAKRYYRAAFYLGSGLEASKMTKKALSYYVEGAEGGDSACQSRLADIYLKGILGKRKDHQKAIRHLRRAAATADRDYPQALFLLATLQTQSYRKTTKIKESLLPIDDKAALENYTKAAHLGCANSQIALGLAYSKPRLGCLKNPAVALHYFRIAARQGAPTADHEISTLFGFAEEGDIVPPNGFLAFKHARRAAGDGFLPAFWQVGHFYQKGVGVKCSLPKAREWYLKGAARKDEDCMRALDSLKTLSFGAT